MHMIRGYALCITTIQRLLELKLDTCHWFAAIHSGSIKRNNQSSRVRHPSVRLDFALVVY